MVATKLLAKLFTIIDILCSAHWALLIERIARMADRDSSTMGPVNFTSSLIFPDYGEVLINATVALWVYVTPCLIFAGTFCNVLSIVTLQTKQFRDSSSGFLFTALAVCDILVLNTGALNRCVYNLIPLYNKELQHRSLQSTLLSDIPICGASSVDTGSDHHREGYCGDMADKISHPLLQAEDDFCLGHHRVCSCGSKLLYTSLSQLDKTPWGTQMQTSSKKVHVCPSVPPILT